MKNVDVEKEMLCLWKTSKHPYENVSCGQTAQGHQEAIAWMEMDDGTCAALFLSRLCHRSQHWSARHTLCEV
jgi:hypothetical protein